VVDQLISQSLAEKTLYDPSIGQDSLTKIDVIGVLGGHFVFAVAMTLLLDWSWIPLTPEEKARGRSLAAIKKEWGWD